MESLYWFLRAQIDEYTLINVYIYQGKQIDSTRYHAKLLFLRHLISYVDAQFITTTMC